jgi:hypothetical protein
MVAVSEASGGQVFLLDPSEIAQSATLLLARDGLDQTLHRVVGELEPGDRTFDVDVDSSVERVLFSVSLQCLQALEVVRPSGALVAASDPDVTWTAFQAGRQIGVRQPQPGRWQARLAGKGLLFMVVNARSELSLHDVRLVRHGGRPGHEGLLRDETPLVSGARRLIEVRLSKGILQPVFELRTSTDARLGTLSLTAAPGDASAQTYVGEFALPSAPFRLVVNGRDEAGNPVQRSQGSLFQLSRSR